jgi:hypothetical protein
MRNLLPVTAILGAGLLTVRADLAEFTEDFETMNASSETALSDAGWLVFGNVYDLAGGYLYGYGVFPAPNLDPGVGFSNVSEGEGGPDQGAQGLVVYSDYNNADHADRTGDDPPGDPNRMVEANVFREQTIGAADVGSEWTFTFDAKKGNLVAPSTAFAFIKTLDPLNGYSTTNYLTVDTAAIPATWGTYSITITIDAGLVGQILQTGFNATATLYDPSGVQYDNLSFSSPTAVDPDVIRIVSYAKAGDEFSVTFNSKAGVFYDLEKFVNPATGWEFADFVEAVEMTETLTDFDATGPAALYRVIESPE